MAVIAARTRKTKMRGFLENIGPAIMLCKSDATFMQHVIAHIDEDLELFFTGEAVRNCRSLHNLEDLCLSHHQKFR